MLHSIRFLLMVGLSSAIAYSVVAISESDFQMHVDLIHKLEGRIHSKKFENGMQVVCCAADNTNQVTVASWIDVGFKDEKGTFGLAHILEHMMFKGTRTLREGYIDRLALRYGLTGSDYNAYTSPDHTFYFFNTDSRNWRVFANVVADILQNLQVTDEALNSELGAIAQEIKLRGLDQNRVSLGDFFPYNHPYSHAGIGYKEEVLAYTASQVMDFYNTHYTTDKVILFVSGNVNPDDVFEYAQQTFSSFKRLANNGESQNMQTLPFYNGLSATTKTVYHPQLYREQSYIWQGPADVASHEAVALDYFASILSTRLRHKWIDELGMCVGVSVQSMPLRYAGMFVVSVQPKEAYYEVKFEELLNQEIAAVLEHGITDDEFNGVFMDVIQSLVHILENPSSLLLQLANVVSVDSVKANLMRRAIAERTVTPDMISHVVKKYLRSAVMNSELRLPLPTSEWPTWEQLQNAVGLHEAQLLHARQRSMGDQSSVDDMPLPQPQDLEEAPEIDYQHAVLSNGIEFYFHRNTTSDKRVFCLLHKDAARWALDKRCLGQTGALHYWGDLLLHGNCEYTKKEMDDYCRVRGIGIAAGSHQVWCAALKNNFEEALRLMRLSLDAPLLPQEILERKKAEYAENVAQSKNDLQYRLSEYLDEVWRSNQPGVFSTAELLAQSYATTIESIQGIINEMRDPRNVAAVMVGDCLFDEAVQLAEKYFGSLQENCLSSVNMHTIPPIIHTVSGHVEVANENSFICAVTATCLDDEYDTPALMLLSEHVRFQLWNVRERTGLFYSSGASIRRGSQTCLGSIVLAAIAIPGNVPRIVTEMEQIIVHVYTHGLTSEEVQSLKENRNRMRGTYIHTANSLAADAVNALEYSKPFNHQQVFDKQVQEVSVEQVNAVIKKYFNPAHWSFVTLGRSHD